MRNFFRNNWVWFLSCLHSWIQWRCAVAKTRSDPLLLAGSISARLYRSAQRICFSISDYTSWTLGWGQLKTNMLGTRSSCHFSVHELKFQTNSWEDETHPTSHARNCYPSRRLMVVKCWTASSGLIGINPVAKACRLWCIKQPKGLQKSISG